LELDSFPAPAVRAFLEVPLLRTVVLNDGAALSIILPWAQLTSLTLFSVYPREYVPVLQKTLNLVHCELEVCIDEDDDQPGPDITLPYLESLAMLNLGNPVTGFLKAFIVPALRSLKIPEEFLGPSPIDSLTGFISKSGCKLEEVQFTGPRSLPKQSYRKVFPSIPKFSFSERRR
jgi:hypothetical protein